MGPFGEAVMASFDLKGYLERFPEVCRNKFGRTYNYRALEKKFEYLRSGKHWLVPKHVLTVFDPSETPFAQYWQKPNEKDLERSLKEQKLYLAPLGADSRNLVQSLLRVLHNIGAVSLLLRFVHPDWFGVFSTPVVNLLGVHRESTVDLYLTCCGELRVWQQHFGMASVAETETALWVFHELSMATGNAEQAAQARAEFEDDIWIQRRRWGQVLRPFRQQYGPLKLARILTEEWPKLAGKIAGEEYERLLRCATRQYYRGMKLGVKGSVEILFGRLEEDGHISLADKSLLRRIWETRNAAVHPDSSLSSEEVEVMIDTIERLCLKWDPHR